MRSFLPAVLFGICVLIAVRAVNYLLGLDVKALALLQRLLSAPADQLKALAWGFAALIGIVALVCWLVFRLDQRIADALSPRPELGSLPQIGSIARIEQVQSTGKTNIEMVVELQNSNSRLIKYRYVLRATVNAKDLPSPLTGEAFVAANQRTSLIVRMPDIPVQVQDGYGAVVATLRYDVHYAFADGGRRLRRTSKLVEFSIGLLSHQSSARYGS